MRLLTFLLLFICFSSCYKEEIILSTQPNAALELALLLNFNDKACFLDVHSNSLRYSIMSDSIVNFSPSVSFKETSTITINGKPLVNNAINNLGTIKINKQYPVSITTQGVTKNITLSFTTLPLVRVTTLSHIVDEPQKIARLTVHYPSIDSPAFSSFIGIEYRGASSQKNPKKSYGFSFLENNTYVQKVSKSLFGYKEKQDWILDAIYNDKAKFRNKLSFEIWKDLNPDTAISIESHFVELYLNNEYQGLYCLNEKINSEHLDLAALENAVLYKAVSWGGATSFLFMNATAPPSYTSYWDGWEQQYPDSKEYINWSPLFDLRNWVLNTSDAVFVAEARNRVDLENIMDYYLLIYFIGAMDNHGKNMFWMQAGANMPFCIVPWDLDASWGRDWDASQVRISPIMRPKNNLLFNRLVDLNAANFKTRLKDKWNRLRAGTWSNLAIEALLNEKFEALDKTGAIAFDNARWGTGIDLEEEQAYIYYWMGEYHSLLDIYFDEL